MESQRKPLILLADDNRINRLLVISTLKDEPYRIVEVTNGREAVAAALHEVPDLILMDLMMPVVSGVDATRELKSRQETARVPILMLTALNATEDRVRAFDAGATGFLTKPFDRLELTATIRSYINLSLMNQRYTLTAENHVTGLPNRVGFRDRRAHFTKPWLYLVKVDGLSTISQLYGETEYGVPTSAGELPTGGG
ncbi:MAG: response regulator [Spirochaetaceae bacterium]|nr:MAG: response regulator [Spirochaetaceae bacterium]